MKTKELLISVVGGCLIVLGSTGLIALMFIAIDKKYFYEPTKLIKATPYENIDSYVAEKTKGIKRLEKQIAEYRENITNLNNLLLSAKTEELKNSIKKDIEDYKLIISYNEDEIKKERIQITKEAK